MPLLPQMLGAGQPPGMGAPPPPGPPPTPPGVGGGAPTPAGNAFASLGPLLIQQNQAQQVQAAMLHAQQTADTQRTFTQVITELMGTLPNPAAAAAGVEPGVPLPPGPASPMGGYQ